MHCSVGEQPRNNCRVCGAASKDKDRCAFWARLKDAPERLHETWFEQQFI
jgi:hypothetical protein